MIDIETLGTSPDSSIIALGVCVFDGRYFETREWIIKPDYDRANLETLAWWRGQDGGQDFLDRCDKEFAFDTIQKAFREASDVFGWHDRALANKTQFWCRGMEFDFTFLNLQLKKAPWKYYQLRDLRTLHKAWGNPDGYTAPSQGVAHRAGDDAQEQNKLLQAIKSDISRMKRGHLL